ncbi:MAG: cupredoxin domain-containing protein [Gallionellaceae bacterium]
MRIPLLLPTILLVGAFAINNQALAADEPPALLVIHNQQFDPNKLIFSAGVKMKVVIRNQDGVPAEFESYDLSREVVVPGHGEVAVYIGPLEPGTYQFFNDFNHEMQGTIVAKPAVNKEN